MNERSVTRRSFLQGAAGVAMEGLLAAAPPPEISITMDDVNWPAIPEPFAARANRTLLDALASAKIRAALFAVGKNVDNQTGRAILGSWMEAGHSVGSHTYSHRSYHTMPFADFSADAAHGEEMVKPYSRGPGLFRFPALKEGDTALKRDQMRGFLRDRGLRNGQVTVDASDWYYDQRLRERLAREPGFDVARFRQPYLDHLFDRATYYDGLARKVLGRSPKHTLLVHYNLINVLFLGDAMELFRRKGWRWISASDAFQDPVFSREPETVPAGESLIWAIAKESGRFEGKLRYPGEDAPYEKAVIDRI